MDPTIRRILHVDPIWSVYALADLYPPFAAHSRWQAVQTEQEAGVLLLYGEFAPYVLFVTGDPTAVAQVLEMAELPEQVYFSVPEHLYETVSRWYDNHQDHRSMMRMVLRDGPTNGADMGQARPLDLSHVQPLRDLYAHGGPFTPDYFTPLQVENGCFYGIFDSAGSLAAAGGTHVVCRPEGVAAIGNVYTRPDCRGRGYARQITSAIVAGLGRKGINTIVLNVDQRNRVAHQLYQTLGFADYCAFVEGVARRRSDPGSIPNRQA